MPELKSLARRIQAIGFSCTRCGGCCQGEDALVMVTPAEVKAIHAFCGLSREEIAEPFPAFEKTTDGGSFTLEWALRRDGNACRFYREGMCTIYPVRPWICRTYPFVLDGERLCIGECPGLGRHEGGVDPLILGRDLLERRKEEAREEERVRSVLSRPLPAGKTVLIDGDGVTVLG